MSRRTASAWSANARATSALRWRKASPAWDLLPRRVAARCARALTGDVTAATAPWRAPIRSRSAISCAFWARTTRRSHAPSVASMPGPGIEATEGACDLRVVLAQNAQLIAERLRIGALHGAVAAVTSPVKARAQRAATRLGNRSQAGDALRHRNADVALAFALHADAVRRDIRFAPGQRGRNQLDQLVLVDGAAAQFEIHRHMFGDGGGEFQRIDVFRGGVHGPNKFIHILPVAQGLDAAGGGTGPNGDQRLRLPPNLLDAFGIVVGGNRSFHQCDVIRPLAHGTGGLGKIRNVKGAGYAQQFIFRVEQTQLATVAGSQLEDCDPWLASDFRAHIFPVAAASGHRERWGRPCK